MPERNRNVDFRGIYVVEFERTLLNKRRETIHQIALNNTNGDFVAVNVISWIVFGRYHHQLFDKAGSAGIAFW